MDKYEIKADTETINQIKTLISEAHIYGRSDVDEELNRKLVNVYQQLESRNVESETKELMEVE